MNATLINRMLAGESATAIAAEHGLELVETPAGLALILPGWRADDGQCEIEVFADSAVEAAEEYVDGGDWGVGRRTRWVGVAVWRVGLVATRAECVYCAAPATAHDANGDPTCGPHADPAVGARVTLEPLCEIAEVELDRETIRVAVHPDEPPCEGDRAHDWETVETVGHGGGVVIREECAICGCAQITDTWAQDTDGASGLVSVEYEVAR